MSFVLFFIERLLPFYHFFFYNSSGYSPLISLHFFLFVSCTYFLPQICFLFFFLSLSHLLHFSIHISFCLAIISHFWVTCMTALRDTSRQRGERGTLVNTAVGGVLQGHYHPPLTPLSPSSPSLCSVCCSFFQVF